jgi:hypothetical protein
MKADWRQQNAWKGPACKSGSDAYIATCACKGPAYKSGSDAYIATCACKGPACKSGSDAYIAICRAILNRDIGIAPEETLTLSDPEHRLKNIALQFIPVQQDNLLNKCLARQIIRPDSHRPEKIRHERRPYLIHHTSVFHRIIIFNHRPLALA